MNTSTESKSKPVVSNHPPERVKAPIVGIIAGLVLVGGLGAWTTRRVSEANSTQAQVAAKRVEDSQRAATVAKAPPTVEVTRGTQAKWQPRVELNGTLEADQSARLAFRVAGKLAGISVRVGDVVKAGQLLGALDASEVRAQLAAAEAQVRAGEAQLELASDAERRTTSLVQTGASSEAAGIQTQKQRMLATAQLDAARAQVQLAKVALGNHTLATPFPGTVTRAPTGVGSIVGSGEPLFEVVNTSLLKLATTVAEGEAGLLNEGAPITIETEQGQVTGAVRAVLSTLDSQTRRVPVQAEFKNPGSLRAGSFVRAWVQGHGELDVVRVPHTVIRPGSQNEALVVDANSTLLTRNLLFTVDKDGSLLVRSGLSLEDRVVVNPNAEAATGDRVQVKGEVAK